MAKAQIITNRASGNNASAALKEDENDVWDDDLLIEMDPLLGIPEKYLLLHKAVFEGTCDEGRRWEIFKVLKETPRKIINRKDNHGNTALHLACMLGSPKEVVAALLEAGASVDIKNLHRWTPFHEAVSYGNREIITMMTQKLKDDVNEYFGKYRLSESLAKTKDYRISIKWEFQSWVPFLSKVLPSDVCVINKQGRYLRIDTKILDYEMLSMKKGDTSLIYSPDFKKKWILMNNKSRKYQHFERQSLYRNIDSKVDEFMSTDIMDIEIKSADIQLTRLTSGWIWKAERVEKVGRYNASLYNFNNVYLITRKRREHLSEEDVKRNKLAYKSVISSIGFGKKANQQASSNSNNNNNSRQQNLSLDGGDPSNREPSSQGPSALLDCDTSESVGGRGGKSSNNRHDGDVTNGRGQSGAAGYSDEDSEADEQETVFQHRESLPAPAPAFIIWDQYYLDEPGQYQTLGRRHNCKTSSTAFKASVAMSDEFPITKNEFIDLLSGIPLKHFTKLKEFIEMRLPDGFPVRVDIPLLPFLSARITFEDFSFLEGPIDESLFKVPLDYTEDPKLFPLIAGKLFDSN